MKKVDGTNRWRRSKHDTLNQCWVDVGRSSTTLSQHQANIGLMSRAYWGDGSPPLRTLSDPFLLKAQITQTRVTSGRRKVKRELSG